MQTRRAWYHQSQKRGGMDVKIGERIKQIRKEKKINIQTLADKLGVSVSTLYRYEDSSIEKIPVHIFDGLCRELGVTAAQLMGNDMAKQAEQSLPQSFENPQEAMEFMLKIPTLAAFGGYHPEDMSEETIVEFANEILQQLKLVSYKYKR